MSESKAHEVPVIASMVQESIGDITVDEDSFEDEDDETSFADSGQLPSGTSDVKNVVVLPAPAMEDEDSENDEFVASAVEKSKS